MLAVVINLGIVVCEAYTLAHVRGKGNIFKYYTYLQNFIALVVSLVFCVSLLLCWVSGSAVPEFVRGLRYIATCGLAATTLVFVAFLGAGRKVAITDADFLPGISAKWANRMLHYICPGLSLASFVLFEREFLLADGIWTGLAAIPSCGYWLVYMVLSAGKLWKEPYDFASQEKGGVAAFLPFVLIPLSFVAISFVLWNIR